MKKLLTALMFTSLTANASECNITEYQQSVVNLGYSMGEPYDLGYTMVAIFYQESELGKWKLNVQDPSAGLGHTLLTHGLKELKWSDNNYNRNRIAQVLVDNDLLSAKISLDVLRWWQDYHKGEWEHLVASYNGGFKGNPEYLKKIASAINLTKKCNWIKE